MRVIDKGKNNLVEVSPSSRESGSWTVRVEGNFNTIRIAENCKLEGCRINVKGDRNTVLIGRGSEFSGLATVSEGASLVVGAKSTVRDATLICHTRSLSIGDDCMFGPGVEIRTTDSHPIYDIRTGERVNDNTDVVIKNYVWLGKKVTVMKGASIGTGCSIALGAVVTGEIAAFSVAGGIPAKVIRSGVCWTRHTRNGILSEDRTAMKYIGQHRA